MTKPQRKIWHCTSKLSNYLFGIYINFVQNNFSRTESNISIEEGKRMSSKNWWTVIWLFTHSSERCHINDMKCQKWALTKKHRNVICILLITTQYAPTKFQLSIKNAMFIAELIFVVYHIRCATVWIIISGVWWHESPSINFRFSTTKLISSTCVLVLVCIIVTIHLRLCVCLCVCLLNDCIVAWNTVMTPMIFVLPDGRTHTCKQTICCIIPPSHHYQCTRILFRRRMVFFGWLVLWIHIAIVFLALTVTMNFS